jgi:hypothetical protein
MAAQHVLGNLARPAFGNLVQDGLVREKTHCQWVMPLVRVVVSSDAMTCAVSSFSVIALVAAAMPVPRRRKALAMAPSEMTRPNSSWAIRDRRSKPT